MGGNSKEFSLKCSDESFLQRQKNVFDELFKLEKSTTNKREETMEIEKQNSGNPQPRKTYQTIPFRGKESIFKMPQEPSSRHFLRRLPDYKKNPHKWTKYSLEDVKDTDISDRGNTKAALSFLKELNERNEANNKSRDDQMEDLPKKIIFQKHIVSSSDDTKEISTDDKPSFKSSKRMMPEYVVGQKIRKERKNKEGKQGDRKELKLDHLFEEDDQGE